MPSTDPDRDSVILRLGLNRRLAHQVLFPHRHPQETPPFHGDIIDLWHSDEPQVLTEAFRGAAKSTLAEEAIATLACLRQFHNCVIIGESEARAIERLTSIKHELETNEAIDQLFGSQKGDKWGEKKIVLQNGVCIQALGRGQSMRGVKHLDKRPDLLFGDDMEDEEAIATPEAREKFKQWFLKVVLPSLAPEARVRIAGTPLAPESFIMRLRNSPEWVSRTFPIEHKALDGSRRATWPARFPLEKIDKIRSDYMAMGGSQEFQQEYMCEATDPATKIFTPEMIRIEPTIRHWQACYAVFDPARTTKQATSAQSGWAVFSWVNNRLIVWEASGAWLKPDEQINKIFEINDMYAPVVVGVEKTGLEEFIMQPLRHEQVRRGVTVPIRPLDPPNNMRKDDFIKGLQPFFKAREVIFVNEMPLLSQQLLSFPTGLKDILNALAFAPRIRPGQPMFEDFTVANIMEDMQAAAGTPCWLAVNSTLSFTTAVLLQFIEGGVHVVADWCREGDPGSCLGGIVADAGVEAAGKVRVVAGSQHFNDHDTIGLRGAAAKVPVELRRGGAALAGRETFRRLLKLSVRGRPAVLVSTNARWTLNALAGGYCRELTKAGVLSDFAREGAYRVLMEGVESTVKLIGTGATEDRNETVRYASTPDGRRYISARA